VISLNRVFGHSLDSNGAETCIARSLKSGLPDCGVPRSSDAALAAASINH